MTGATDGGQIIKDLYTGRHCATDRYCWFSTFKKNLIDFAENNGLCDYLQFAIDCLRSSFSSQAQFIIIKDTDPEINDEWINIGIQEEGNVQDIINKYDHIIDLWVQHVPWPQRSMIRFSF